MCKCHFGDHATAAVAVVADVADAAITRCSGRADRNEAVARPAVLNSDAGGGRPGGGRSARTARGGDSHTTLDRSDAASLVAVGEKTVTTWVTPSGVNASAVTSAGW